jgi:quercetin dioxygenase-like cupin family protein
MPSSSFTGGDFETQQPPYGPAPAPLAGAELPSFRFPLGTVAPKTFQGGSAKEATVAEFPVSDKLAGVYMTLEPGALRELHWHANAAEWAYVIDGRCRVTTIDPENQAQIVDFGPGDVWYFPRGHGHSIQGIGPAVCAFVLVFDNGYFSEFGTFSISDWVGHTPAETLAKNFGVPAATFANFPKSELVPEREGSVLSGRIVSQKENWIINRVMVHVRINETRHCGEKLQNVFSDTEWDKYCADNPNYSVEDVVDGKAYQCFVGSLEYLQQANCNAKTLLIFDPAKQHWDFFLLTVTGHPKDPLGAFR